MRSAWFASSPLALLALLPVLAQGACLQNVSTGTGTTDSTSSPSSSSGSSGSSSGSGGATGTGCGQDARTGVTLCLGIDACPGLSIDPDALPGCGFRLHGTGVLDLECLCEDALCPLGVPDTCAQVMQVLSSASSLTVCQQATQGQCVDVGPGPDAGTASSPSSACNKACASECSGVLGCLQLCGC